MLELYICEDNTAQREFITSFISDLCIFRNLDAAVVLSSPNPYEVLEHYKNSPNPALFFLDIDLGAEINGIELASRIRECRENNQEKTAIVFLTTHSELALTTLQYKVEALDFILKGSGSDVKKKIADCISTVYERNTGGNKTKTIKINAQDKIIPLDMDEIIFIETTQVRHKLRLHTISRTLEFNGELKAMGEQLDERFIRCHKTCIINKDKIAAISRKENAVTMVDNSICPISRGGKKLL